MARRRRRNTLDDIVETRRDGVDEVGGGGLGGPYTRHRDAYTTHRDAYGQTDVLNDPNWLRANIRARTDNGRRHPDAQAQQWIGRLRDIESGRGRAGAGERTRIIPIPGTRVQLQPQGVAGIGKIPGMSAEEQVARAGEAPQGDIITGPAGGPSTAAMNRPKAEWGTPANVPAKPAGGIEVGKRYGENVSTGQVPIANAGAAARPNMEGGGTTTNYRGVEQYRQPIEAGTIGASKVMITGPNHYETHTPSPWVDTEGVYGTPGKQYITNSVVVHQGQPDNHPQFQGNPDYIAKRGQDFRVAQGGAGVAPFVHSRGDEKFLRTGGMGPEGVDRPISELTPQERVKYGVGSAADRIAAGTATPDEQYLSRVSAGILPDFAKRGVETVAGWFGGGPRAGAPPGAAANTAAIPKPAGIDTLVPPPEPIPKPRGIDVVRAPTATMQSERERSIPRPTGMDTLVAPPELPSVARTAAIPKPAGIDQLVDPFPPGGTVQMAGERAPGNVATNESMFPTRAPVPDEGIGVPFRGTFTGAPNPSSPAGVSNRQAADIETPTNKNAIARTETSPELDINKTDQTTAAFLGGRSPQAQQGVPYVPPPKKRPEDL